MAPRLRAPSAARSSACPPAQAPPVSARREPMARRATLTRTARARTATRTTSVLPDARPSNVLRVAHRRPERRGGCDEFPALTRYLATPLTRGIVWPLGPRL